MTNGLSPGAFCELPFYFSGLIWALRGISARLRSGVGQAIAVVSGSRGKSGLHRVECQVTPGGREPTESAAERKPPKPLRKKVAGKGEKVR